MVTEHLSTCGKKVCVVGTAYALLLYLLHLGEEDWSNTLFVFQDTIPGRVRSYFPNSICIPSTGRRGMSKIYVLWRCVVIGTRLLCMRRRWRRCHKCYAQDNLFAAPFVIGRRPYVLLSDGPMVYSVNEDMYRATADLWRTDFRRRFIRFLFGIPCYGLTAGQNSQCVGVVEGEHDPSPILREKTVHLVDVRMTWNGLSDARRKLLLSVFDVNVRLLQQASSMEAVLITQPFASDGDVSEGDLINIYQRALVGVNMSRLIIKPHPRDTVDYSKAFPGATILSAFVPFQLLSAMGFRFRKAVTISSSSISDVEDAEIVWIGNEIDNRIVERYGAQRTIYEKIMKRLRS